MFIGANGIFFLADHDGSSQVFHIAVFLMHHRFADVAAMFA